MKPTPRALGMGLLVMAAMAGCQANPQPTAPTPSAQPAGVSDALASARSTHTDVMAALDRQFPGLTWEGGAEPGLATQPDGRCLLSLRGPSSHGDLYSLSGRMEDLPALLTPVLATHGYGELAEPREWEKGGGTDVEATSPNGWRFTLTSKGSTSYLSLSGPVAADPCNSTALPE